MIKLSKGAKPQILIDNATQWTNEYVNCLNSNQTPSDTIAYRYRHPDIKAALEKETNCKCAYCESKMKHISFEDIEHILPKKKAARPDLYVEWTNLTLACEVCNRTNKKDYYDPKLPLVNPYVDDPDKYFIILGTIISSKDNNERGFVSESTLDLNRPELVERRNERLKAISALLYMWAKELNPTIKDVLEKQIRREYGPEKEYSAFVKEFVRVKGFPV